MHYLITGGGGFIGTNLTLKLLREGNKVTVLDNFVSSPRDRLKNTEATVVEGNILNKDLVLSLAKNCDYLIHLAAIVGVRLAMQKGCEGLKVSYIGTENILEAAYKYNLEVFLASSSAIYGKVSNTAVSEDDDSLIGSTKRPSWLYSIAKLNEEHLSLAYNREFGVKVKIGRFFNVIGPYQTGIYGMVVPTFINKALNGEPLIIYGTGHQTRTFCHVNDILNGVEFVIRDGKIGEVYNIGGTNEITILNLAKKIIQLTESNSKIEIIPYEKAFDKNFEETTQRVPNINKLIKLGYKPKYSLDETLKDIIEYQHSLRSTMIYNH